MGYVGEVTGLQGVNGRQTDAGGAANALATAPDVSLLRPGHPLLDLAGPQGRTVPIACCPTATTGTTAGVVQHRWRRMAGG